MADKKIEVNSVLKVDGHKGGPDRFLCTDDEGSVLVAEARGPVMSAVIKPFGFRRGVLLAGHVVAGSPPALTNPASIMVLAATVLFLAASIDRGLVDEAMGAGESGA